MEGGMGWDYRGSRILITGATGLIGRALTDRLLAAGARLRTTSRRPPPPDFPSDRVEHLVGDLAERAFAEQAAAGMVGLFHLAGRRGSVGIQLSEGATMLGENLSICFNVLEAARRAAVARVLYASTITVYPSADVYREDDFRWGSEPQPSNQYVAWAKRMAEKFIEALETQYGVKNTAIVRPVNTFGPHDDFDPRSALVVPALIVRALSGEDPFVVWGDGSAVRDFLYVSDVVDGTLLAFEKGVGKGPFNIGSGRGCRVRDLVTTVLDVIGRNPQVRWDPSKPAGDPRKVADITKARQLLGFEPKVDLRTGIERTVEWYRKHGSRRL
jgi:GDP-L-fucose synthase